MLAENLSSTLEFFKTKSPNLIGVDIASTSIKMVELSESGRGAYRLERYAIEPLSKDLVQDGNIGNLDQVADVLRRGFKRLGSRNKHVALALPAEPDVPAVGDTDGFADDGGHQLKPELDVAVDAPILPEADDLLALGDEGYLPLQLIGERRGMDGVGSVDRRPARTARLAALDPDDGIAL